MKTISILGSTGSIGTQALDIIRKNPDKYRVSVLSCASRISELTEQIKEFRPEAVITKNEEDAKSLSSKFPEIDFDFGTDGLISGACHSSTDIVLNSLVGMQGMVPTYHAIKAGKTIALANKETLVAGGDIIMKEAARRRVPLVPVDSEHSAIFQCLQGVRERNLPPGTTGEFRKIIITASGGPFRGYSLDSLEKVTLSQALKHPNWSMGRKITIDSATLMNKGLEVIEAHHLFNAPAEKVDVVVHPQSIIHSMVEFEDRAVIAQLGLPDMRVPIAYSFSYPDRIPMEEKSLDLAELGSLTFEKPDTDVFRPLALAYEALETGGGACCALNAANEVLVDAFLNEKIQFTDIQNGLESLMNNYRPQTICSVEDVLDLDREVRLRVREGIRY